MPPAISAHSTSRHQASSRMPHVALLYCHNEDGEAGQHMAATAPAATRAGLKRLQAVP